MKPAKWISTLGAAVLTASAGCAVSPTSPPATSAAWGGAAVERPAPVVEAGAAKASEPRSQFRLTSARLSDAAHAPDDEKQAGNEFVAPPAPAPPANAEAPVRNGAPLTLKVVESLACQHNPTLRQAQAQRQGELGKAIQAGLWPNPRLNYVQEQIGVAGTPGEFVGGTVSQRIVTARKLDLSRAKFLARAEAAQWRALEQEYRVLNDVRRRYFETRGRYELVEIHRELLKSAEDNLLTERERYNVGQATRADVHLANVALQRARLDLIAHENEYREAFELLAAVVGVDLARGPLETPLQGDLQPIGFETVAARLFNEAPQLQAAREKLRADRIKIDRELAEPVPDIVVEAGAGRNFEADETVASARVSIEAPLFDWNQGTVWQAQADYARQRAELRRIELTLRQKMARAYRRYVTALQHATNYEQTILPEARQAYELQLRSYKDNRITWPEVLRTQQQYFMLRAEYVRNLIAWRESEVLIVGYLLEGGLTAPEAIPPGHIEAVAKPR